MSIENFNNGEYYRAVYGIPTGGGPTNSGETYRAVYGIPTGNEPEPGELYRAVYGIPTGNDPEPGELYRAVYGIPTRPGDENLFPEPENPDETIRAVYGIPTDKPVIEVPEEREVVRLVYGIPIRRPSPKPDKPVKPVKPGKPNKPGKRGKTGGNIPVSPFIGRFIIGPFIRIFGGQKIFNPTYGSLDSTANTDGYQAKDVEEE